MRGASIVQAGPPALALLCADDRRVLDRENPIGRARIETRLVNESAHIGESRPALIATTEVGEDLRFPVVG